MFKNILVCLFNLHKSFKILNKNLAFKGKILRDKGLNWHNELKINHPYILILIVYEKMLIFIEALKF